MLLLCTYLTLDSIVLTTGSYHIQVIDVRSYKQDSISILLTAKSYNQYPAALANPYQNNATVNGNVMEA